MSGEHMTALPEQPAAQATAPTHAEIAINHVTMVYQSQGRDLTALQDVSLYVDPGEFVSLIGPSGCGKSTLMRLVGDLEQPTAGSLRVKGKTPQQARLDRDYGIAFQAPVLYDWRTVRKNVELPLEVMNYSRSERRERAQAVLAMVGLGDFGHLFPWQLSGGMQQRVAIARALVFEPSILLMDEPFGALDEMTRERMQSELLRIWSGGGRSSTVIFVTHSIAEAVFLSDRVVVMSPRPGRIEQVVEIDLPRPRDVSTRTLPRFFELVTAVRESLRES
jgi:NitT/TauT family transport system ATP-binding protein